MNWLVATFDDPSCAEDPTICNDRVHAYAHDSTTAELPEPAASIVGRYAPVATIINSFYAELFTVRRDAPYPATEVGHELSVAPGRKSALNALTLYFEDRITIR